MPLNVVDKRSPGDLWHGRSEGDPFETREDRIHREPLRDCPGMVAGWKKKIAWCREEVRLIYQLQDAGLDLFQVGACIPQAKAVFYGDSDPDR